MATAAIWNGRGMLTTGCSILTVTSKAGHGKLAGHAVLSQRGIREETVEVFTSFRAAGEGTRGL